jgi:CheY-like chemotaxis protein
MSHATIAQDVIVADNDYIIRDILRSLLVGNGFSVLSAADGLAAIDYAARTHACLIILDLRMPKLDGIAACAQIRRLPGYADVPIAILSAFDSEATRQAARHAGATTFLAKPFKPINLLRAIAELLDDSPADGGAVSGLAEPAAFVWPRRQEPAPLYAEPVELSEGRRVLNICRR